MRKSPQGAAGFTLIELLVVVTILGALAAIAIPAFSGRQGKGYDARLMQDARNAATAEEAYYTDNASYFDGDCTLMPGVSLSPGVNCTATAAGDVFSIRTTHPQASYTACTWKSDSTPNLNCS